MAISKHPTLLQSHALKKGIHCFIPRKDLEYWTECEYLVMMPCFQRTPGSQMSEDAFS